MYGLPEYSRIKVTSTRVRSVDSVSPVRSAGAYHDMEVDVFTVLLSWKQSKIL